MKTTALALATVVILGSASLARDAGAAPRVAECLAANESAIKHRNAHELKAAKIDLLTCSSTSCPGEVQSECARRLEDVDRATPSVVLAATDGSGNDLFAVKVWVDGAPLSDRLDASAVSLDPGNHELRFETAGFPAAVQSVILREGEKNRVVRVVFDQTEARSSSSPWRGIGLGVAGAGVAGLVISGIFAGLASSSWSQSQQACASSAVCPDHDKAVRAHDSAMTQAGVSTALFVGGAILVVAGGATFFLAPRTSRAAGLGFALGGTF